MKTIGLIGGLGPESTVDYYKRLIAIFQEQYPALAYPEIIVWSANMNKLLAWVDDEDWDTLSEWLAGTAAALARAGADFAVIASNTPHVVFDEVQARSPIPLLSIVEATCRHAERLGVKRLGLLGTQFTMAADYYPRAFRARGMELVVPSQAEQQLIQKRLFQEIELGVLKASTRDELLAIVKRLKDSAAIEAVILGCTELPLILDRDAFGIPFLNTTAIHVARIVETCLSEV
jgi:aspartate racemase